MNFDNLISQSFKLLEKVQRPDLSKYRHFSFLLKGKKIVSIGWNNTKKTHPLCLEYGYQFGAIHSEVHAILRCGNRFPLNKLALVNVQIRKESKVDISAPCSICQRFLFDYGVQHCYYTNKDGEFEYLDITENYYENVYGKHSCCHAVAA